MLKSRMYSGATGTGLYSLSSPQAARLKADNAQVAKDALESTSAHKYRSLLALDGAFLPPSLLKEAQANCLQFADRVDILMVNPPKTPIAVLCELLLKLEQAGIDYRLTFANGRLGDQITRYLRRFLGIRLVIMKAPRDLVSTVSMDLAGLLDRGVRFVSLKGLALV
jgi:hypothetical protein